MTRSIDIKRARIAELLAPAPATVRARMLAAADDLKPGAAAVVGRFFTIVAERGEPRDAPSRASFDAAAASEPTLHTLLSALARHAPEVSTAAGREARDAWYRRRSGGRGRRRGPAPVPTSAPGSWPEAWRALYPGLRGARIADSSRRIYIRAVGRCAAVLGEIGEPPALTRWLGYRLMEAFEAKGLRPATIVAYLTALEALAKHGGVAPADVAGLKEMRSRAQLGVAALDALKVARVQALDDAGGYAAIMAVVASLAAQADAAPGWSAVADNRRRIAAILGVAMNAPARGGDVSGWVLGRDLIRTEDGRWRLSWTQGKTGGGVAMGALWPEVCGLLDDLILAGAPARMAQVIYRRLAGMNWLTRTPEAPQARYASTLVEKAIGAPLHDLRTLAADHLREHDPRTAPDVVSTLLGHRCAASCAAYRARAEGDAACRDWRAMRETMIAARKPRGARRDQTVTTENNR